MKKPATHKKIPQPRLITPWPPSLLTFHHLNNFQCCCLCVPLKLATLIRKAYLSQKIFRPIPDLSTFTNQNWNHREESNISLCSFCPCLPSMLNYKLAWGISLREPSLHQCLFFYPPALPWGKFMAFNEKTQTLRLNFPSYSASKSVIFWYIKLH